MTDYLKIVKNIKMRLQIYLISIWNQKIRNIKVSLSISPTKPITLILRGPAEKTNIISSNSNLLKKLVKVEDIVSGDTIEKPAQSAKLKTVQEQVPEQMSIEKRKNGISAPSSAPILRISGNESMLKIFDKPKRVAAALLLAPPMPEPKGIFFFTDILMDCLMEKVL